MMHNVAKRVLIICSKEGTHTSSPKVAGNIGHNGCKRSLIDKKILPIDRSGSHFGSLLASTSHNGNTKSESPIGKGNLNDSFCVVILTSFLVSINPLMVIPSKYTIISRELGKSDKIQKTLG